MSGSVLNVDTIKSIHLNEYAIRFHSKKYLIKEKLSKLNEVVCLLNVISVIDLTTLSGDDTVSNITALINKALYPISTTLSAKILPYIRHLPEHFNKNYNHNNVSVMAVEKVAKHRYVLKFKINAASNSVTTKWQEENLKHFNSLLIKYRDHPTEDSRDKINLSNTVRVAAVCIYPQNVEKVVTILKLKKKMHSVEEASGLLSIASVAAGFPSGQFPLISKLEEITYAVSKGATEIDVVIDRSKVIGHRWLELYNDLKSMRTACNGVKMKTILSIGECGSFENIYKASMIAMMAGSDTIKTSTGKELINAAFPEGIVMCRAILKYYQITGRKQIFNLLTLCMTVKLGYVNHKSKLPVVDDDLYVGFKPAGGIKTCEDAVGWLKLVTNELGPSWLSLFRIGASGLLSDIIKRLEKL